MPLDATAAADFGRPLRLLHTDQLAAGDQLVDYSPDDGYVVQGTLTAPPDHARTDGWCWIALDGASPVPYPAGTVPVVDDGTRRETAAPVGPVTVAWRDNPHALATATLRAAAHRAPLVCTLADGRTVELTPTCASGPPEHHHADELRAAAVRLRGLAGDGATWLAPFAAWLESVAVLDGRVHRDQVAHAVRAAREVLDAC